MGSCFWFNWVICRGYEFVRFRAIQTYVDALLLVLITSGIVSDPTTKGLSDSKQAMTYAKPRSDK